MIDVTSVVPVYDFKKTEGGCFSAILEGNPSNPFNICFLPFLNFRIQHDESLFRYLKKKMTGSTASHAIYDLYDIGFPVPLWVREYVQEVGLAKIEKIDSLVKFYSFIKGFGSEPTDK